MAVKREIAPRIVVDDKWRVGKPVIKGTRVSVDLVAEKVAGGMTFGEVARAYGITRADVFAASAFATRKTPGPGDGGGGK